MNKQIDYNRVRKVAEDYYRNGDYFLVGRRQKMLK